MPDATSKPSPTPPPRRWTIFAAALLLFALALVVIYTSRRAFSSPLALVVVAAIGMAALLLQLRLRKNQSKNNNDDNGIDATPRVRSPLWLNVLGVAFALAALAADILHWTANAMLVSALGAVICFAISATAVLHSLRKK